MKDQPWAITVDGSGTVSERRLADQGGGTTTSALKPSFTVLSKNVAGNRRTVVLTGPLKGPYFNFTATSASTPARCSRAPTHLLTQTRTRPACQCAVRRPGLTRCFGKRL